MQDILNQVFELLRNAWRFRWLALAVAWAVAICGWLFVYSLPDQYQSDARLYIDTQSAIQPMLQGLTIQPDVDRQVNLLIQTVLSRPNLETIARRTGLDLKASTPAEMDDLIAGLQQRIKLRNTGGRLDLYRISFVSSDAQTAQNVVQQVINIMTGMAVGDGGQENTEALAFLSREVESYKKRVDEARRRLTQFKKDNAQLMPGNQDYVTRLQSLLAQTDNLRGDLSAARDRKAMLQVAVGDTASGGGTVTLAPELNPEVRALEKRISDLQNQLGQLLGKYTPKHPDVVSTEREIERLQDQRGDKIAYLRANPQRVSAGSGGGGSALRRELDDAQLTVNDLEKSIQRKQDDLDELKSGADDMADAQAQLAELARTYDSTRDQYEKLTSRLYSARLSENVKRSSNPLQFRTIDPPDVPTEPIGPNRAVLITVALMGSLAAGAAFAFLMSQLRPVFINRRGLTQATGLPVLGSVSVAWTRAQTMRRQTALLLFLVGVGVLVLFYAGALAFTPIGVRMVPSFISGQWL